MSTDTTPLVHEPTSFERVLERATDPYPAVDGAIWSLHGLKMLNPPASLLPYLIWEYGLGELQPYVPNLYDLIREGIAWQRVRGTPAAMARGLGWLGYSAKIEEAAVRWRWWNHFQLELDRVRDDEADLPRIDGIAGLSVPLRSDFWRGFAGYDVRAAEGDYSRWDGSAWEDDSGVRVPGGKAKWSFGRRFEFTHEVTAEDLGALGIPDPWALEVDGEPLTLNGELLRFVPAGGGSPRWGGPWLAQPWASSEVASAAAGMLAATGAGPAWAVFKDAAGEVLFYRRCRVRRGVVPSPTGVYRIEGARYAPATSAPRLLYLEALTAFGEGHGSTAASVGFILSAAPAATFKPGVQHLPPGGLMPAGPIVIEQPLALEFGRTTRDCVALLLRF
ncbi:phage tail protein [Ancylobacter polymorphus]|uniref:Phage tail protein n=1 Tax=Ancylobacter polymorphus TaxID=223390 RepID=A0ABU0B8J6_9HYPH|nr:phage tail protein [Ancylobacter polymorphus]MDQ0301357.1 hypothetical protein [Ancylobacter polymorphus]